MNKMQKCLLIVSLVLLSFNWNLYSQQLAFPGAEGFGRYAVGGRGGAVYHVTNLNDAGAGSFRDAVSAPNRIVVFDVGGVINITTRIVISHHITVAGQTAPGGGITIYGNGIALNGDSGDDIIRYIRIRMGKNGDSGKDAVGISENQNYIFDHVSISWGRDGTLDVNGTTIDNLTFQDCIISQGINNSNHSTGGLMQSGKWSIIRSLYIDNKTRNPKARGTQEFINSVLYNWATDGYIMGDTEGTSECNMMGNYFIYGPSSSSGTHFTNSTSTFNIYASDNWVDSDKDGVLDGSLITSYGSCTVKSTRYSYPGVTNLMSAQAALTNVINKVGPYKVRDAVDNLLINQLKSYGTLGSIINTEDDNGISGNVGTVANGTPAADSDGDGMSNAWETANGTNPNLADHNGDLDGDGYTNIEEYLDYMANGTVTVPATLTKGGSGSSSQTVTVGSAIASFYYTWANATSATASGLPSGVTATVNATAKTITISGTPTATGTFNFTVATTGGSPNATSSGTITVNGASSSLIYQGENASIVSGVTESTNAGYTGTGYANTNNAVGNYVEWTVTTSVAGSFNILFRYASVGDRPADIYVNGTKVISALAFPTTTVWTTWTTTATKAVTLINGANKIRATATTSGGCANIDYLQVSGSGTLKRASIDKNASGIEVDKVSVYPNPLNSNSVVALQLKQDAKVSVKIYNAQGKLMRTLADQEFKQGSFDLKLNKTGLQRGIYLCKIVINNKVQTCKLVVKE
jgi:hypothetical protein